MNRLKTYRFKLMPDKVQEHAFVCWLGTTRYIYNLCLEYKKMLYSDHGISISKNDLLKELTPLKNDVPWMNKVCAQTLQAVVDRLDRAYAAFFRRVKKGEEEPGFPKFTNKSRHKSFLFKQSVKLLPKEGKVFLPKIGHVRYHKSQEVEGTIKIASVKKEASGWYVYLACEVDIAPLPLVEGVIGIDLGLKHAVVTSDGEVFDGPKAFRQRERQLKRAQQHLSRKEKRSNNRKKSIAEVSRIHERIRNARKDFLHKTSSAIVRENQTIIVEDLQVGNMMRKCKPKKDENGKFLPNGQAAKRGLNKSFSDAGLGALLAMLEYKSTWAGRTFVRVPAHYTSMDCHRCNWRNHELTLADREWTCGGCGAHHDRDANAAKNILARGVEAINKGAGAPLLDLEIRMETFELIRAEAEGPNHTEFAPGMMNAMTSVMGGYHNKIPKH